MSKILAKSIDWYPSVRVEALAMAMVWANVFIEKVKDAQNNLVAKYVLWGIPDALISEFMELMEAARAILDKAISAEFRTKIVTEECRIAFDALEKIMRQIKEFYLKMPPLTSVDMISLHLKVRDKKPARKGKPTGICVSALSNPHRGAVLVKFEPGDDASSHDPNAQRICFRYGILPRAPVSQDLAAARHYLSRVPVMAEELPEVKVTNRMRELIDKLTLEAGNELFVSSRFENNSGEAGPWSEIYKIFIT